MPRIAIRLQEGNRRDIVAALLKGDIDVAVMGKPPDDADVAAEPFAPHPSVLIHHPATGWPAPDKCRWRPCRKNASLSAKTAPVPVP